MERTELLGKIGNLVSWRQHPDYRDGVAELAASLNEKDARELKKIVEEAVHAWRTVPHLKFAREADTAADVLYEFQRIHGGEK